MQLRRVLTLVAACALASFAMATAAQAAPTASGLGRAHSVVPAKVKKLKGAKYYNFYFDPYFEGEYLGYHLEPPFFVVSKTKSWGYEVVAGEPYIYGNYETYKVKYKEGGVTVKYSYTVFKYNDDGEWLNCEAIVTKTGWDDGSCYFEPGGEYFGAWYAEKS
jgi:hypothetical protein